MVYELFHLREQHIALDMLRAWARHRDNKGKGKRCAQGGGGEMTNKDIIKLINAIRVIEADVQMSAEVEYFNISLITNGDVFKVKFLGIDIWCSECDDIPISFSRHLRRCIAEELDKVAAIRI